MRGNLVKEAYELRRLGRRGLSFDERFWGMDFCGSLGFAERS
jgi:hypothetical protein